MKTPDLAQEQVKDKAKGNLGLLTYSFALIFQYVCDPVAKRLVGIIPTLAVPSPPSGVHVPAVPQPGLYPFPGRVSQRHQAPEPPCGPRDGHPQTL